MFAESYLYAFQYLISPGVVIGTARHPNNRARARNLIRAARAYGIEPPDNFETGFMEEKSPKDSATKFSIKMADALLELFVGDIITSVAQITEAKSIPQRDKEQVNAIYNRFRNIVAPVSSDHTLVDILNAAWKCDQNLMNIWTDGYIRPEDKFHVVADLTLKSMEVSEVYHRIRS